MKILVLVHNFSARRKSGERRVLLLRLLTLQEGPYLGPPPPSYHDLRRSTDVQAMLSPYRIEVDINRQNVCDEP
jgi:hypothetical protein